jgi:arylsulfatase A-like enzyme
MKRSLLILTALLLAPLAALRAAPLAKPNALIILVDDMGWCDPQYFNLQSKIAMPHIDQLAAEGMKFTNAHAGASICVPSWYSLLTGRMPYRNWNAWLTKQLASSSEPFFINYAIPAPHAPWATASEFSGKSGPVQYGDYVINLDAMIGEVMTNLEKLKLKDNTLGPRVYLPGAKVTVSPGFSWLMTCR